MVTFKMVETALGGLCQSLIDDDRIKSRKCPRLRDILRAISLTLALLQQIVQQVQELEKFKESLENQKRFTDKIELTWKN